MTDIVVLPIVRGGGRPVSDRDHFHRAVSSLLAAGLSERPSVLAPHGSRAAAGEPGGAEPQCPGASATTQVHRPADRRRYHPLSGGLIAATVAALVGAVSAAQR